MFVGIASDHGGFHLKQELAERLRAGGYLAVDFGAYSLDSGDDYPDFVIPLAKAIAAKELERGVAICGSGVGASICANKIGGVRAALIGDTFSAHQGVEDDDMNVICLGGRTTNASEAWSLLKAFLEARFSEGERHIRRLRKVASLERTPANIYSLFRKSA